MSSQPSHRNPETGYRDDFVAWADTQAALLRARRFNDLDLENLLEEVEGLSGSERRALSSQIRRVIEHLLKLIYSPALDPRRGWKETIINARAEIEAIIEASPSLRGEIDTSVEQATAPTIRLVVDVLALHEELTPAIERSIKAQRFTAQQILGDWFPDT